MIAARWIETVNDRPTADVAAELGYEVRRGHTASHCKCPACGAERRHTKTGDRRGAVGMPHSAPGWHCFQCEASGDAIDFVAYHMGGRRFRDLDSHRREEVRAWFDPTSMIAVIPPKRLRKQDQAVAWENADAVYPPRSELEALWGACVPVDHDDDALAYLAHRSILGIDELVKHDCVRALPCGVQCPEWARFEGDAWNVSQHRLLIPLYDYLGDMRSVVARSVSMTPRTKSVGAVGFNRRGLVMAGTYGREMLIVGPQARMHRMEQFRLTVKEGEISFLRAISNGLDRETQGSMGAESFSGVFGIFSGSFTRDVASRVPRGSSVVIATDDDHAGHRYGEQIVEAIGSKATCTMEYEQDDSVRT